MYFSLLNMAPHLRSNIDHMQLVLLCTEKDSTYSSAIKQLERGDTAQVQGIKSVFKTLQNFDVCLPGMPSCLGHDIFEGVLSFDVAL